MTEPAATGPLAGEPSRRWRAWAGGGTAVVLLLFAVSPYWAGWQLRQAMRTRDTAALQARVDWTTLRANLKPRLAAAVEAEARASGSVSGYLKRLVGGAVADKGVDLFVTPANLARILAGREFVTARLARPASPAAPPPTTGVTDDPEEPDDPMPPRRLKWAFFETPLTFRFEATHPRLAEQRIIARLGWQGLGWRLVDVDMVPVRR